MHCSVSDTTEELGRWKPTGREDKRTRPASVTCDEMKEHAMDGKMDEALERTVKEMQWQMSSRD